MNILTIQANPGFTLWMSALRHE